MYITTPTIIILIGTHLKYLHQITIIIIIILGTYLKYLTYID